MQLKPEALQAQREKKLREEARAESGGANVEAPASLEVTDNEPEYEIIGNYKGTIKGSEFPEVVELCNTLYGIHWEHQKKMLDVIELLSHDERQFSTARKQAMAHINSEFANMNVLVRQTLNAILKENRMIKQTLEGMMNNAAATNGKEK